MNVVKDDFWGFYDCITVRGGKTVSIAGLPALVRYSETCEKRLVLSRKGWYNIESDYIRKPRYDNLPDFIDYRQSINGVIATETRGVNKVDRLINGMSCLYCTYRRCRCGS